MKRIIYENENGKISIVTPTGEIPTEEVAKKDVPAGVKYWFVEDEDIPTNRYEKNSWGVDFSAPHGKGIGHKAWERNQKEQRRKAQQEHEAKNFVPAIRLKTIKLNLGE